MASTSSTELSTSRNKYISYEEFEIFFHVPTTYIGEDFHSSLTPFPLIRIQTPAPTRDLSWGQCFFCIFLAEKQKNVPLTFVQGTSVMEIQIKLKIFLFLFVFLIT